MLVVSLIRKAYYYFSYSNQKSRDKPFLLEQWSACFRVYISMEDKFCSFTAFYSVNRYYVLEAHKVFVVYALAYLDHRWWWWWRRRWWYLDSLTAASDDVLCRPSLRSSIVTVLSDTYGRRQDIFGCYMELAADRHETCAFVGFFQKTLSGC